MNLIEKINKHPWVVFVANFATVGSGIVTYLTSGLTPKEFMTNANWTELITVFLLTVIVYHALKRCNAIEKKYDSAINGIVVSHASFTHHFQANQAIAIEDFWLAYFHLIHAVKNSFNSQNTESVFQELTMIKDICLPHFTKDGLELFKKDRGLDIEELLSGMQLKDKNGIFSVAITSLKLVLNRLPATMPN